MSESTSARAERSPRSSWAAPGWALAFVAVAAALQAHTSVPFDTDTAYHVAVGRLIREHGILRAFPWTPFSILALHYADKELLFHLLFVPLSGLPWIAAAKIVGTLTGAASLFAIYFVLRAEQVRQPGVWTLAALASSGAFVFRFALVRPHVLVIGLAVLALWAAARGRLLALAIVSALYPWVHVSWQLPVVLAAVPGAARIAAADRWNPRPVIAAAVGLAVGLALHPSPADLIRVNWIHLSDIFAANIWERRADFIIGNEFDAFTPLQALRYAILPALMCAAAAVLAWRDRRHDPVPVAFALAAVLTGLLTARSARFIELFAPFSATALAIASRGIRARLLPPVLLGACAVYTATIGAPAVQNLARRVEDVPPALAAWLRRAIPPGSQVFTCEWESTGPLMLALPDRRFIVALDPTLFYVKDPELYRLWYRLPREAPPGASRIVQDAFGARYVLCLSGSWPRFYARLASEPGARLVLATPDWTMFELGETPGAPTR